MGGAGESWSLQGQPGAEVTGCDSEMARRPRLIRVSLWTLTCWPRSPTLTLDTLRACKWELERRGRTTLLAVRDNTPGSETASSPAQTQHAGTCAHTLIPPDLPIFLCSLSCEWLSHPPSHPRKEQLCTASTLQPLRLTSHPTKPMTTLS